MRNIGRTLGFLGLAIAIIFSASINIVSGKAAYAPARLASAMEAPVGSKPQVVTSYTSPLGTDSLSTTTRRYWDDAPTGATLFRLGDQQEVLPGAADQVRVIVQMSGEPVSSLVLRSAQKERELSPEEAMQLRSYEGQLAQAQQQVFSSFTQQGIGFKVERQYTYLLNAAALTIHQSDFVRLQHTPGVMTVYRDYKAKVNLQESVPLIGAPTVWNMTDAGGQHVTGKGLRVAVIDTGIDYTHPDLGGCFGVICKVAGGYDFVNNDFIPQDDYGHGTHVAGIIAANGTIKGVAPDATLYAYKVCDAFGGCDYSAIIAGLERAADPDQNPLTNDAVDVANLSLGGPGDPTDILSQAVDAATAQGIVVVVAAGNTGPDYNSIGSPGAARTAITVAASDKADTIAYFSSRGPIPGFYDDMKPDITAPGVDIYSTVSTSGFLGDPGRYTRLSGTSMATPHVAGAAALLLQLHPTWTPVMIKETLMNTAIDLGQSANLQGAGRLNVAKAAVSPVMIDPPSIGFGLDDVAQSTWTVNSSVVVTNKSNAQKSYSISTRNTFPNGATLSISPKTFNLAAGQSQTVTVNLSVNNSLVPNAPAEPFTYENDLIVTSGTENWNVPLSFVKSPSATFVFDESPWIFLVYSQQGGYSQFHIYPTPNLTILLPQGTYDAIAIYNPVDTVVIKENMTVPAGVAIIPYNKTDAIYNVNIDSRDENGLQVFAPVGVEALTHKATGMGLSLVHMGGFVNNKHFSAISPAYAWNWATTTSTNLKSYDYNGLVSNGLSGDLTFTNTPAQLKHVVMKYSVPPSVTETSILHWVSQGPAGGFSVAVYDYGTPLTAPFERDVYILPRADASSHSLGYFYEDLISPPFTQANNELLTETSYLIAADLNTMEGYAFGRSAPVLATSGSVIPFNLKPPHWSGKLENDATNVRLKTAIGSWPYLYMNQSQDFSPYPDLAYTLASQSGTVISQGVLDVNAWNGACSNEYMVSCATWIVPAAGAYSLTVPSAPYFLGGMTGSANTKLDFNTSLADPNPPALYAMNLLEGGQPTDVITPNVSNAALTFEVGDESGLGAVTAEIMLNGAWQSLTLQSSLLSYGTAYSAALPPIPSDSYVSLRITAADTSANKLTYTFWLSGLGVVSSARAGTNPTGASSVDFTVTFSNAVTGVDISDFDLATTGVAGAGVSGVSGSGATYTVSVNAGTGDGTIRLDVLDDGTIYDLAGHQLGGTGAGNGAFTGGETYTIAHNSPSLLTPLNTEHLQYKRPTFDWLDFTGAGSYQLQVSKNSSFSTTVLNKSVTTSKYVAPSDLTGNTLYYWRVRAKVGMTYTPWSDTFTFTTGNPPSTPALVAPGNAKLTAGPSPLFDWNNSTLPAGVTFAHYEFEIATDSAFSNIIHENEIAGITNSQDALAILPAGATYYWHVRSVAENGDYSTWSAVWSVKIKYPAPTLLSPANLSAVASLKPTFTWSAVANATGYNIQISKTPSFGLGSLNINVTVPTYTATANLLAHTTYYWRVRTTGAYGPSDWSTVFSFTTP